MKKIIFLFILPFIITSCIPRKCCEDQFSWKKGKPAQHEFQYNLAFSEGNKIYTVGGPNKGAFESYDIKTKHWNSLPSILVPVSFASGVILNHVIYIFGGIDSSMNYSDAIQTFDLLQNKWSVAGKLNRPLSRSAAVVLNDKIYLLGGLTGIDDQHASNSTMMDVFDPLSGTWEKKKELTVARHGHEAIVTDNKILVAGGFTDKGETDLAEEYDPESNEWIRMADLPYPNGFFGLISMGERIYAMGGRLYDKLPPVIRYDTNADQWTQVSTMPENRNRFGVAVVGKYVYVIGGENAPGSVLIGRRG